MKNTLHLIMLGLFCLTGCAKAVTPEQQAAADNIQKSMKAQNVTVAFSSDVIGNTKTDCLLYEITMNNVEMNDKTASVLAVQIGEMLPAEQKADIPGITIRLTDPAKKLSEKYSYLFAELTLAGSKMALVDSIIGNFIKADYVSLYKMLSADMQRTVSVEETVKTFAGIDSTFGQANGANLQGVRFINVDGREVMQFEAILTRQGANNILLMNIAKTVRNEVISIKL